MSVVGWLVKPDRAPRYGAFTGGAGLVPSGSRYLQLQASPRFGPRVRGGLAVYDGKYG